MSVCLRFVIYLMIPLSLYLVEEGRAAWVGAQMLFLYHFMFGVIAFFIILTVMFSRKDEGFRVTTMDFLVIFIAMTIPNIPNQFIQGHRLGFLAVEIIVLLFSYEVMITELQKRINNLAITTAAITSLIAVRGWTGF